MKPLIKKNFPWQKRLSIFVMKNKSVMWQKQVSEEIILNFGIKGTNVQNKKRLFLRYNTHSYFAPDLTTSVELEIYI